MNYLDEVISKIRREEVILWAGSGFSLYAGYPTGGKLIELIKETLSKEEKEHLKDKNNLPDVAEEFVQLRGRNELYQILMTEFSKEPLSVEYHQKISEIPQIKNIITTNYDTLFEIAYKDDINIITHNIDLPRVSHSDKVNLYKIHGDLNEPETIIITRGDYTKFFKKKQYEPIWSKITSLIAEHSILFIGYSFEDQNVKFIFENILDKIGDSFNKGYLVLPDLPEYKIKYLHNKYTIEYIEMKAEDAVSEINKEIKKHVLEDYREGEIDEDSAIKILEVQDIKVEITKGSNKSKIIFKETGEQPITINATVKSKGEIEDFKELIKFIKGERFGKFEKVFKEIEMKGKVGDVNIPSPKGFKELKLEMRSLPKKKFMAYFTLKNSSKSITGIKGESFLSQRAFQVDLNHSAFIMKLKGKPEDLQKIDMSLEFTQTSNLIERRNAYEFFNDWVQGDTMLIHTDITEEPLPIKFGFTKLSNKKNLIDKISVFRDIYGALVGIQNFYNVSFKCECLNTIENDDIEKINELMVVMEGGQQKIESFPFELEIKDENSFKNMLKKETFNFKTNIPILEEVKLFGKTIKYCIILHIEGKDCYLVNIEEVKKQYQKGDRAIKLDFKSKNDNLYKNWEPIDCNKLDFKTKGNDNDILTLSEGKNED